MQILLTVRDIALEDLADLEWSGGSEHTVALAKTIQACYTGDAAMVVVALPNGRLIANGTVDFRRSRLAGELMMLSVHDTFQGIGVGTQLILALEDRIRERGLRIAQLGVEHDNPGAAALYRRLGYRETGAELESWSVSGGRTYVTVCMRMEHDLTQTAQ